ncbi:IQ calmodulinbinding motif domain containing protein [Acanthamoeba castellanii str. Neff]|uniref:IQ calmodulinbinding motif domain containing protein n=1 Tax=Acanthamoeba castellanii (strain ATCC 30010 / Neff) TaxID=1257118 RepID=L8GLE9_ACACF|nr:IQ calmodulinbinding motif domain containing protein [Acanthamoeba castellanii str. Neff]ELR13533.1 IQ calmodulinbinding motif domain containing protein [Acanthamoeba castellanii str. Neff]
MNAGSREIVRAQAVVRGYLARQRYAPIEESTQANTNRGRNTPDTERTYVQGLHVIVGIFSIVEALLAVNQELLKNLEQRYKNWSQRQTIGDVFLQMSPHLKGYSEYCRNYDYAVSYLDRLQASTSALAHFIQAHATPRARATTWTKRV